MDSEDNLLRRPFLINTGGGGEVKGHRQGSLSPCTEFGVQRGFWEWGGKRLIKEHLEGKLLTSKEEATFVSAG